MRRVTLMLVCAASALVAACSSTTGLDLPLVGRARPFAPVEGVEQPALAARARGVLLSGHGEKPISVRTLPGKVRRDHPIRGELAALSGPALDGTFVYAARDDRPGLSLHRANVDGRDEFLARCSRSIHALSISADAAFAAILAPFPEDDPRSLGGSVRELVLVDVRRGTFTETGFGALAATPAWIDASRVACAVPSAAGVGQIVVFDARSNSVGATIGVGERAVRDAMDEAVIAFEMRDGALDAARVVIGGAAGEPRRIPGVLEPLAMLDANLLIAFSSPTLGAEPQWEFELFEAQVALATIKVHDLLTGEFSTLEARASPRHLWSAGRLSGP